MRSLVDLYSSSRTFWRWTVHALSIWCGAHAFRPSPEIVARLEAWQTNETQSNNIKVMVHHREPSATKFPRRQRESFEAQFQGRVIYDITFVT
ncbi:hypothetical protein Naga_100681g2 [Nannochloropsis gaditana]|uniref:Uncharacterized protein n=1 Tax=Nannochloropsis gaditana TaxID=72520 RepID=W7T9P1_9STRA|nr:hypothetical protein Naga_100681g2 [Nannochloropsis gaditana]